MGKKFNSPNTNGDDVITGTNKSEVLKGKNGDDEIKGGFGNDLIDGGKGEDTAIYDGSIGDFFIFGTGFNGRFPVLVIDNNTADGNEGIDLLLKIEFLQFADAGVNVATGDTWHYVSDGVLDISARKGPPNQNDMINGNGIPADHFGISRNEDRGIELAFKVHHREGSPAYLTTDTYADGVLHFQVNDGPRAGNANHAEWNLDWSLATGLNGETTSLDDFTFQLLIDTDASAAVDHMVWELEALPGVIPAGFSGFGWRNQETNQLEPVDDKGNSNVTQNSQNFGFGWIQQHITGYGPATGFVGNSYFDIQLLAFDDNQLIAKNHISVDVVL